MGQTSNTRARQSSNQHDEAASVPEAALHLLRLALPPAGGEQSDQHGTNMNGTDSAMDFAGSRLAPYSQSQTWKFPRHEHYAYLNGHRGERHRHKGWRYYDGYCFPPAAFVVGG